jgi:transposase
MVIGICHRSWEVPVAQRVRARRLTDEEGRQLQQIVRRSKHGSTRVRRALIVMASASGTTVPAIARLVAADEDTVRQVIHRFNEVGLACLDPRWAGGRPRRISHDDEAFIVQAPRTRPEKLGRPFTHWSVRKLAAYLPDNPARVVEVRRERLRQLLRHHKLSFQRTRTWKESTDPEREAKLDRIEEVTSRWSGCCSGGHSSYHRRRCSSLVSGRDGQGGSCRHPTPGPPTRAAKLRCLSHSAARCPSVSWCSTYRRGRSVQLPARLSHTAANQHSWPSLDAIPETGPS